MRSLEDRECARTIDESPRMMTNQKSSRADADAARLNLRMFMLHVACYDRSKWSQKDAAKSKTSQQGKKNDNCEIRTHAPEDCGFNPSNSNEP